MTADPAPVALIDLAAQRERLGPALDDAMRRVVEHGRFIMGPEVAELEEALAAYCGARRAIACASGTDALLLALLAWGVGPGDAVFVPGFTFAATAEVVALMGATPVFVDVDGTSFNLDVASLRQAVAATGMRPAGVITVDLFGQPADYGAVDAIAAEHGMWVLADAAQSFGAQLHRRPVGTFGTATGTSFFPTKPLGCYGDGGAVFTADDELAAVIRSLRVHGRSVDDAYEHVRIGTTARLDTLQAAVLLTKLPLLDEELAARRRVAARYSAELGDVVVVPTVGEGATSAWAQYTVQTPARDEVAARLQEWGVPTAVHYPRALSQQPAYRAFPTAPGGNPVAEALAGRVLSLPMHPYLTDAAQQRVIGAVRRAVKELAGGG